MDFSYATPGFCTLYPCHLCLLDHPFCETHTLLVTLAEIPHALSPTFIHTLIRFHLPPLPLPPPSSYIGLGLGSSFACLAADVLAAVLLPIDNHDAAAAPLLVPLLPAPAAVPVPPARFERALGPQRAHGRLGPELGRRRPRDCIADHPAACLPCLAAASR